MTQHTDATTTQLTYNTLDTRA